MIDVAAPTGRWRTRPSATVDRPRLRAVLDGGAPLVLLRGPRGAGKSTLIDQWVATLCPAPVVVRMAGDRDHADDAGFWPDLEHAMARATGGTGPDHAGPRRGARRRVRQALHAVNGPVLLVVEHAERIADDSVHRDLVELVASAPWVRAVVTAETTVLLERLAVADLNAVVVDFATLRFTLDETVAVLERHGVEEAPRRAREMVELLHGWPGPTVALLLQRQRLDGGWDSPMDPRTYVGLVGEFLDRLHPATFRDFLVRTSVVDELTVELARMLGGTEAADEHFARLAASPFVRVTGPGAGAGAGVRSRQAVVLAGTARHALTVYLEWSDPDLLRELHTRVAGWYREAGDPVRAARHAHAAPAPDLLAQVVDESSPRLFTQHSTEMRTWLDALPDDLDDFPIAASVRATFAEAPPVASPAQQDVDGGDLRSLVEQGLPLMIKLHIAGRYVPAAELAAEQAAQVARVPDRWHALGPDARTMITLHWGLNHLLAGDLGAAQRGLGEAYRTGRSAASAYLARNAAVNLAMIRVLLHDLAGAEEWLVRADALPPAEGFAREIVEEWGPLVRALVASHRLETDAAERALADFEPRRPGQPGWILESFARAHLGVLSAHPGEAMARLERDQADHAAALRSCPLAASMLTSVGVDLALRLGRPVAAQTLLDRAAGAPGLFTARARVALAIGDRHGALGEVAAALAGSAGHVLRRPDLLLVRACATDGLEAEVAWSKALVAVRTAGTVRSLALLPRRVLARLGERVPGTEGLFEEVRTLPDAMPEVPEIISLSERERLVLRELARTASHREIAQRLFVSVNTVKTQVRSIYRKLGTSSRAEALATAQAHGFDLSPIED